ncbi:silD transmembrane protein involved in copper, silver resistance [Janthinobacterium agaricidamnosum NBRC 102515 = DSM 9628]|uniref:SilD transmembrane protein involved in copper, silver resistance n=2 Tax=Janthinobacterium agaricidamnosum TaxID=55508 RepID=W0V5D1_9BURK|nr:silD transmembrane protein involved in copper, silver resistance [Janthinobacterium agaricidamnosum NBRC 102515 = DSM 9628]
MMRKSITATPMKTSRPFRFVTVLIALFSMLFMQLAVAAYACPNTGIAPDSEAVLKASVAGMQNMPGCTGMDVEHPSLCHAHTHGEKQSLDKPDFPQVPPFMAVGLTLTLSYIEAADIALPAQSPPLLLLRSTAPPLAIRHCCFRI